MRYPPLSPDQVDAIKTFMAVDRSLDGRRWTSRRIANALRIDLRTVKAYRRRIRGEAESLANRRSEHDAGLAEARKLIGLDE